MAFLAAVPALLAGTASAGAAAGAATGFTALGTGLSAAGGIAGGLSSFAASRYQAAVADNNAKILTQQANNTREAGQTAESEHRTQVGQLVGQEKAAQGANGVDVGYGSTADVRDATKTMGDFDALTIRYNAARQAWGQDVQAMNQRNQAAQARRAGTMALAGSFIGAASSIAGGLGKIGSMEAMSKMYGVGSGGGGAGLGGGSMAGASDLSNWG